VCVCVYRYVLVHCCIMRTHSLMHRKRATKLGAMHSNIRITAFQLL
jgi:hypothetical protein